MADTDEKVMEVEKLKVAELRKELADRGLDTKGNKPELVSRLEDHLEKQGVAIEDTSLNETEVDELQNDAHEVEEDEAAVGTMIEKNDALKKNALSESEQQVSKINLKKTIDTPDKVTVSHEGLLSKSFNESEKKLERIKRFGGTPSETDKKLQRAQRFGTGRSDDATPTKPGNKTSNIEQSMDIDKLKRRAERFGVISPVMSKIEESDRLKKRKERFGVSTTTLLTKDLDVKRQKRAERFGL